MFIVYLMVAWFLVLLFSDNNYHKCAIIILLSSVLNIVVVDMYELTLYMTITDELGTLITLDGVTALALSFLYFKDKLALNMSLLLVFSVLCHGMVIYNIIHISLVSSIFYAHYDELIMTIGILQMAISSNGITSALRNIREHLLRISFYSHCYSKGFSLHKRSGARS